MARQIEACSDLHCSQDRTNRFAMDALIRSNGYRIFSRNSKHTLWIKEGRIYLQSEVLVYLDPDEVWEAEYIEMLYHSGHQQ